MFGATAAIRRFIAQLGPGEMFCTRDVLQFGSRTAVDKALSRMVHKQVLARLTSGLFVRRQFRDRYSLEEIAEKKAKAFMRHVWMHGTEAAQEINLTDTVAESGSRYFSTDGPSSAFQVGSVTVFLKHVSMRKVQYLDSIVGKTICAFWSAGESSSTAEMFASAIETFSREQVSVLIKAIAIMPQWLTDRISITQRRQKLVTESVIETICSSVDPYEEFDPSEFDSPENDPLESASEAAGRPSHPDLNSS